MQHNHSHDEMNHEEAGQAQSADVNLLFIAGDFAPMVGGIASFMYNIVCALPSERVRVIATPIAGSKAFDQQQSFDITRVNPPPGWRATPSHLKYLTASYLRKMIDGPRPDFVICCHGRLWLMLVAAIYQRFANVSYAVFLHGTDILDGRRRKSAALYNRLLRNAQVVFANSRLTADAAAASGVIPERLTILYPCVSRRELQPSQPRGAIRQQLGLADQLIILTVARLVPNKGIDVILDALPIIRQRCPNIHYVIVGDGPSREELRAQVAALGIERSVSFVGYQPRAEIANYYQDADVFALTPRRISAGPSEAFGLVYLEANMLELPVVAARVGGVQDAVVDGENGLLVTPEAPDEAAQAILTLLLKPKLARQLGIQGRKRAEMRFGCAVAAEQLLAGLLQSEAPTR